MAGPISSSAISLRPNSCWGGSTSVCQSRSGCRALQPTTDQLETISVGRKVYNHAAPDSEGHFTSRLYRKKRIIMFEARNRWLRKSFSFAIRNGIPAPRCSGIGTYVSLAGIDQINNLMQNLINPVEEELTFEAPDCSIAKEIQVIRGQWCRKHSAVT